MVSSVAAEWSLSPKQAVELQRQLAKQVVLEDQCGEVRLVAGADIAMDPETKTGFAGIIVFELDSLREVERVSLSGPLTFPYVSGLLSFREGPLLLKLIERLTQKPDLFIFDGQGVAHPRRLGIASHLGILLKKPTIGCGKSRLCGNFQPPGSLRGACSPLLDRGEIIGSVLRTRDTVNPIFVSPGHMISHEKAREIILKCCDGFRIPKPTRLADKYVAHIKSEGNTARSAYADR